MIIWIKSYVKRKMISQVVLIRIDSRLKSFQNWGK